MKKQFARAALVAALLCGTAGTAAILPAATAFAADNHVSRDVGEALNSAIKAAKENDFAAAAADIQKAEAAPGKTDFDTFQINQIKAFVAVGQKDYATAATAYEAVIASPFFASLADDEKKQTLHNTALLSAQARHWPQVVSALTQLEKLSPLDDRNTAILAQAYYFTDDYANAAAMAQKSIDMAKAKNEKPEQASLQILMSAQAKSNDQAGALKTLEELAVDYNDPSDWGQLVDLGLSTKGMSELDALYLYRLRFMIGAKSAADDYTTAAAIAIHQGYPTEAEKMLQQGLSSGVLSQSGRTAALLSQARDGARADARSLPGIAAAASHAKSGTQDVKLAEDYWGYGRYADAVAAAKEGIAKGGMKDTSEAQYILGIAQIANGQYADAQASLAKVDSAPARDRGAHLWSLYAQSKIQAASPPPAASAQQQQQ